MNWKCEHAASGCNYPEDECVGLCENDKQAEQVAMKYYDEHRNDKLEGLLINNSKHVPTIACFDKDRIEVLRIQQDGDVIWKGRKVKSDAEFKAAMIDLANVMKANMYPAQPVQPVDPVAEVTAKMMLDQEWRIYAYKVGQLMVGTKLYAEAPAAAINEQMLDALKPFAEFDLRGDNLGGRDDNQPVYARDKTILTVGDFKRAKAAIRAAEVEKAKGGK